MTESKNGWAFVNSRGVIENPRFPDGLYALPTRIHAPLFGYYSVKQTSNNYVFTLMQTSNPAQMGIIGYMVDVPLSCKMGEGDYQDVTPEKIIKE